MDDGGVVVYGVGINYGCVDFPVLDCGLFLFVLVSCLFVASWVLFFFF